MSIIACLLAIVSSQPNIQPINQINIVGIEQDTVGVYAVFNDGFGVVLSPIFNRYNPYEIQRLHDIGVPVVVETTTRLWFGIAGDGDIQWLYSLSLGTSREKI